MKIVDAQGRIVPTASNLVKFTVTGAGQLLGGGNGDPASHEPDKTSQRSAPNGLCLAIIQAGRTNGVITLRAESASLHPATVSLEVQ